LQFVSGSWVQHNKSQVHYMGSLKQTLCGHILSSMFHFSRKQDHETLWQRNRLWAQVRRLVDNGQLQFVNGGWVQHDEAAAHYVGMLDQTARGHGWLLRELGVTPRVTWQIDPFGHSATQVRVPTPVATSLLRRGCSARGAPRGIDRCRGAKCPWPRAARARVQRNAALRVAQRSVWTQRGAGLRACDHARHHHTMRESRALAVRLHGMLACRTQRSPSRAERSRARTVQASLLTEAAGFDALFFARADYQDLALRQHAHASEMIWRPRGGGGSAGVFTGTFPNHYGPPPGFNFEWGQHDLPIQERVCLRCLRCTAAASTSLHVRGVVLSLLRVLQAVASRCQRN
jgi:Glycosyl hydrolases family 38 N-terminal domain